MHAQTLPKTLDQPTLSFEPVNARPQIASISIAGFSEPGASTMRFTRSVVEEAGLGQFVYVTGISGKRYVFSAIKPEQVCLYENAIFALTDMSGECVSFCKSTNEKQTPALQLGSSIYVHLLSGTEQGSHKVLADLAGSTH